MAVDQALIAAIAPEYNAVDPARLPTLIGLAQLSVNAAVFGQLADYATALVVCHMLKVGDLRGKGLVTEESIGDLSRSYAQPTGGMSEWTKTSYGSEYLRIRRQVVTGVTISGDGS